MRIQAGKMGLVFGSDIIGIAKDRSLVEMRIDDGASHAI
jgi:hypothetical protein